MAVRHRTSVGIFEAAILLALAAMVLWIARPIPGARRAAAEEKAVLAVLGAIADAEEGLAPDRGRRDFLRLDRLASSAPAAARALEGWTPSEVPGVYGNRSYWLAVLLPGREGWIAAPGKEEAAEAARGFCVVAWPRREAAPVLRALAALPRGTMWQRADGMAEGGEPSAPPVPGVSFPLPGQDSRVPNPPYDWASARRRRP